jgi:hypothetical protein
MWGTEARDWSGGLGDGRNPVIIPWWPRHLSALPNTPASDPVVRSAQLRSRRYQWAGPALRMHGQRVDAGPVGHAFTFPSGPALGSQHEIRGLATAVDATPADLFDWTAATVLTDSGGPWNGAPKVEVDGAEYRIHLVYTQGGAPSWSAIADAAAERLDIRTGLIRGAAPVRVLAVEAR